jgi:hypothetical protein
MPQMRVDYDSLISWMRGSERQAEFEHDVLEELPHLHLVYEEDLEDSANHQITLDKISEFLAIPAELVKSTYQRSTPQELSQIIVNYDEIEQQLRDTKYRTYLEN